MTVRLALYGMGFAFVFAMIGLTVFVLVSPNVLTENCTTSSSASWSLLTILAAMIGMFIIAFAYSEERH